MFGVAGDPITPLIHLAESQTGREIKYYGFRNEQAASYASSAVSFLSQRRRTGVCLTVAGPGFLNALTGLANANVNQWPNLLVCPLTNEAEHRASFQFFDQVSSLHKGVCKGYFTYTGDDSVKSAILLANTSPFGSVVLFIPMSRTTKFAASFFHPTVLPCTLKPPQSNKTLILIGGAVPMYPETFPIIKSLLNERGGFPFIADSLARGILPESHPYCVSAARSLAMSSCSAVIIIGGRLDWMMLGSMRHSNCHFTLISDDPVYPSDFDSSRLSLAPMAQLGGLLSHNLESPSPAWVSELISTAKINKKKYTEKISIFNHGKLPSHLEAIAAIKRALYKTVGLTDALVVSEGANTMDVARITLDHIPAPYKRLDAGRWGTMGAGLGYVLAAHAVDPHSPVICIKGDSALGFSGMELETIVRYKCKVVIFVFNNGGIYTGKSENSTAFTPNIKHDLMMTSFGGTGLSTRGGDAQSVERIADEAFSRFSQGDYPILVDVIINPDSGLVSGSLSRL